MARCASPIIVSYIPIGKVSLQPHSTPPTPSRSTTVAPTSTSTDVSPHSYCTFLFTSFRQPLMINATKMLLIQLTIVFPFLAILASAQSETYPDCCAALRTKGLSVCDFDFLGSTTATTAQTACVCSIDGIDTPLNESVHAPQVKSVKLLVR